MAVEASKFLVFFFQSLVVLCCSSTTRHDMMNPPTIVFSTNPTTTPPVTIPPLNPTSTPITTIPVTIPPNPLPLTTPGTVTVPGGDPQPVTNPVTTYPTPTGTIPVAAPPAFTNAPAIPGQSWCVARMGASEAALQSALDYACGIGGADCSQIQQGGSCYEPSTLPNHASYAFNSYYQKNPSVLSCDFGGTAVIVSTNPSTGSCIYPFLSLSSPSTSTGTTPNPSTQTVTPPATTTPAAAAGGGGLTGFATPQPIFNPANPISDSPINPASGNTAVFGFDGPPTANASIPSISTCLCFFIGCGALVTSIVASILVLDMQSIANLLCK